MTVLKTPADYVMELIVTMISFMIQPPGSTVVEHSTLFPKIKGSNPATGIKKRKVSEACHRLYFFITDTERK